MTRSRASLNGASHETDAGTLGSQLGRGSFGRQYANGADVAASATFERSSGVGNLYFPAFDAPGTNQGIAEDLDGEQVGEIYGRSVRNLFDAQFADPASDEHAVDAIQQNGRTARIGIRWKFWTP